MESQYDILMAAAKLLDEGGSLALCKMRAGQLRQIAEDLKRSEVRE